MWAAAKSLNPRRRHILVCALMCVTLVVVSTKSQSQAANPQSQGIAIKADAASLCALVGKMQVITFKDGCDPATAEPREWEPDGVGYTRKRNILLFGRQVKRYGKSAESGAAELPSWRNFRLDTITTGTVNALVSRFDPVRPDADEHRYISQLVGKPSPFDEEFGI